jgi:PKD repeat protein
MMKKMLFSNLSTGDIKECLWNFGDNATSTELKPTHEYAAYGEYKVCLTISTMAGCKSDYCATVKVENLPGVSVCKFDIVVKPKEAIPNTFLFYAVSSDVINSWKWSFGDGKSSDLQNPEHVYEKTGTYEVSCIVTTVAGCTETRTIKHTVLPAPLANCTGAINILLFDPTNNRCNGKATVSLKDASGTDIPNVKYIWSDNRMTSTVENLCPDKTYSVQAIVEGVCQKSYSFTFLSNPIWRISTVNGQSNFKVIEPKEGVQYEWNFGNGTVLTGADVNFNFATDGVYEVQLKAASGGDFSVYTQQVVVTNNTTGTKTINKSELEIYPNPVKEMLKINFGNPVEGKLLIEIINIIGQKSYTQQLDADGFNHATIDVQHLKSGIYFLRITTGQHVISDNKFIKVD